MIVNLEILMRALATARQRGEKAIVSWSEVAKEFMQRQDAALRDARQGHREALDELARQAEQIKDLSGRLAAFEEARAALARIVSFGPDHCDAGMLSDDVYYIAKKGHDACEKAAAASSTPASPPGSRP